MKPKLLVLGSALLAATVLTLWIAASHAPECLEPLGPAGGDASGPARQPIQGGAGAESRRFEVGELNPYSYHAATGTELRFALRGGARIDMRSEDGVLTPGPAMEYRGCVVLSVRSRTADALLVEVRGQRLAFTPQGAMAGPDGEQAARQLVRELEQGALVRLHPRGEVLGYRFAKGIDPETRNWIRNFVDATRVGLADTGTESWTVAEHDAIGKAEVLGAWTSAERDAKRTFSKKRARYLDAKKGAPRPELEAGATGTFDTRLGWVAAMHTQELARLALPELRVTVLSHTDFRIELEGVGEAAASATTFDEAEAAVDGSEDAHRAADARRLQRWQTELEGVSTQELVAKLLELARGNLANPELMAARERLVWAVRLDPSRLAEIVAAVRSGQLEENGLMVLLAAVGAACTDAAQLVLAELTRPELELRTRVFALRSLFQATEPSGPAVAAALAAAQDRGAEITSNTGLLLVGGFAGRDARHVDALLGLRDHAVATGHLSSWLEAVGNSGAAKALPSVEPHLTAEDAAIRSSALSALRDMPGENVLALLEQRFTLETDLHLRSQAATILASRPEPASLRFAERVLAAESDDELRIAALRGFASRTDETQVRQILERTAAGDRSARVRDHASRMLRDQV